MRNSHVFENRRKYEYAYSLRKCEGVLDINNTSRRQKVIETIQKSRNYNNVTILQYNLKF